MKKKSIRFTLLTLLFMGSLASHLFLNSSAANPLSPQSNPTAAPQTTSDDPDNSREIVVPDVTIIQKVIELAGRILSGN